ncbi:MAG: N-acetylmuramoyl-L-alanine amidase [Bacteroidaceae bacterium]|nr:N-acetylmuramoyl-L-alanine amidase [Bacteroidaceae bacterium]
MQKKIVKNALHEVIRQYYEGENIQISLAGVAKFGQCSYHYYVRCNGDIIPLLPESVQGVHVRGYNSYSLGIAYEGGLDALGKAVDTRTPEQKQALHSLLRELTRSYPEVHIVGHSELPRVAKACPCFPASKEYADLQPGNR